MVAADDRTGVKIPPLGLPDTAAAKLPIPHYLVWGWRRSDSPESSELARVDDTDRNENDILKMIRK
jgi:hypothetical protein